MKRKLQAYLKSEFTGWKKVDIIWIAVATAVILSLSIYWKDSIIGIIAALTGIWCVILTGKGKRSSFLFGIVNVVFYALIAMKAKYYGEVMLNLVYYFPMNFVGWFSWKKHMDGERGEVIKRSLPLKKSLVLYGLTAAAIFLYGLVLKVINGNLPFIDSMSTIVSVVAQILSVKRLTEQWILWIIVDVVTVIMWVVHMVNGGESIAMLLMWSIYLLNAIFMYIRWKREVKMNEI